MSHLLVYDISKSAACVLIILKSQNCEEIFFLCFCFAEL